MINITAEQSLYYLSWGHYMHEHLSRQSPYSSLPNKCTGPNKSTAVKILNKINLQVQKILNVGPICKSASLLGLKCQFERICGGIH